MKCRLFNIGLGDLFLSKDKNSHLKAINRMADIFHQEAFSDIRRKDSRLRTYGILKTQSGIEDYLSEIKSIKERTALTKFRLSNHALMIEKGRHKNIDKTQRFCPFCPGVVEDEKHFLLKCNTYRDLRCDLLSDIIKTFPSWQPENSRFESLVNDHPDETSRFIYIALEVRGS